MSKITENGLNQGDLYNLLKEVQTQVNKINAALDTDLIEVKTKFNAVLAKLDADAGVTDTNYAATQAVSVLTADYASSNNISGTYI